MYSFPSLEPVCCSMSSSNCCFFTCIQISQEAGQVVCYSHILNNLPLFVMTHRVKGFAVVNKAEVDVFFLELSCFFYDPVDAGNLISGFSAFSKSSLNFWEFISLLAKVFFLFSASIPFEIKCSPPPLAYEVLPDRASASSPPTLSSLRSVLLVPFCF